MNYIINFGIFRIRHQIYETTQRCFSIFLIVKLWKDKLLNFIMAWKISEILVDISGTEEGEQ